MRNKYHLKKALLNLLALLLYQINIPSEDIPTTNVTKLHTEPLFEKSERMALPEIEKLIDKNETMETIAKILSIFSNPLLGVPPELSTSSDFSLTYFSNFDMDSPYLFFKADERTGSKL